MKKIFAIWGVSDEVRLKLRLLSTGKGISMSELITQLTEQAWEQDTTIPSKKTTTKIRRIIKRFGRDSHESRD